MFFVKSPLRRELGREIGRRKAAEAEAARLRMNLAAALARPAQGRGDELKKLIAEAASWAADPDSQVSPDTGGDWEAYYVARRAARVLRGILGVVPCAPSERENS